MRTDGTYSNRTLLTNVTENSIQNETEKNLLITYKELISQLEDLEINLKEVKEQITELSSIKNSDDILFLKLKEQKIQLEYRIEQKEKQLFDLENTESMQKLIALEKDKAIKRFSKKVKDTVAKAQEDERLRIRKQVAESESKKLYDKIMGKEFLIITDRHHRVPQENNEDLESSNLNESKEKVKFCKKCGNTLDKNKKCTECGKQYFYPQRFINNLQPKYCKYCGNKIDSKTRKCTSCEKQYFRLPKHINNYTIISFITVIAIVFITLFSIFYKKQANDIIVEQSDYVSVGNIAHLQISGEPNTHYDITITYKDGTIQPTESRTTPESGNAYWRWYVPRSSCKGPCSILIESDNEYATTTIIIT